jgi:hypothetical protein
MLSVIEAGLRSPLSAPTTSGSVYFQGTAGGFQVGYNNLVRDTGADATSAGLAPDDYPFYAGAIYTSRAAAPFRVTPAGALTATSGAIGGWTLAATSLTDTAGTTGLSSAVTAGDDIRFWAGHATPGSAPFRVTEAGALVATSATISGVITATSGTVGGWTLGAASLTGGDVTLHNTGYLLLGTGNDIARLDAADATYRLWVGNATAASAPFRVTKAGVVTMTSATVTGSVTSTSGAIGGWITQEIANEQLAPIIEQLQKELLSTARTAAPVLRMPTSPVKRIAEEPPALAA